VVAGLALVVDVDVDSDTVVAAAAVVDAVTEPDVAVVLDVEIENVELVVEVVFVVVEDLHYYEVLECQEET